MRDPRRLYSRGRFPHAPSNSSSLERQLQSKLHYALASRPDQWIAGCEVGCQERTAEHGAWTGGIAGIDEAGCARGIGGYGNIEYVEDLPPQLGAETLGEVEVLEQRQVQVVVPGVAEDVAAQVAEGSKPWRNHERVAVRGHVAASGCQCGGRRSMSCAPGNGACGRGRRQRIGIAARVVWVRKTACGAAGGNGPAGNSKSAAVGNTGLAGWEVGGIAEKAPAVSLFPG